MSVSDASTGTVMVFFFLNHPPTTEFSPFPLPAPFPTPAAKRFLTPPRAYERPMRHLLRGVKGSCAPRGQCHGGGLCTQRPPTIVATTSASRSSHGSR